jgi:hypothetical protein
MSATITNPNVYAVDFALQLDLSFVIVYRDAAENAFHFYLRVAPTNFFLMDLFPFVDRHPEL